MRKLIAGGFGALAVGLSTVLLAPAASAATINPDTVALFQAWVNYEADRYGTGYIPVVVGDPSDGDSTTIAETNGYRIRLATSYAVLTPEQFDAYMADDFAAGWEPAGCGGIAAVAIHEMGHVVDEHTGRIAYRTVAANASQVGYDLHGYAFYPNGGVDAGEAVAVSFQAVECGSATATEQSIYNVLVGAA